MNFAFDHIAQQVPNIREAVGWYQENIPGVRVLHEDASWAFIEANGVKLAFVLKDQHPGHLAWRVSSVELERLAVKHGKEIATHRDRTRSFYLEAPGSQWIEVITWDDADPANPGKPTGSEPEVRITDQANRASYSA